MASIGRAYERAKEGPQGSPFEPFRIIGGLLKWVAFIIVFFLVIGIIFYVITAGGNAQQTGVFQVLYTKTDVALSQTPLLNIVYNGAKDLLKFRQDPSLLIRGSSWDTEVNKNKDNEDLGLKFTSRFAPLKDRYLPSEEIVLNAEAEISSLKDDSNVKFLCSEKNTPEGIISIVPSEPIKVVKNQLLRIPIVCRIPANTFTLTSDVEQVTAKKIKLNAVYDFKTKAYQDIYTMKKDYLDAYINKGINPFAKEDNPRLNKNTRQTKPQTTYGPMELALKFDYPQPITDIIPYSDDNSYYLGLRIQKSSAFWEGRLNKINQVYIYLSNNFELVDDNFEPTEDISISGLEEEQTFKKYRLRENKINELNDQCKYYSGKDTQECQDLLERGFVLALTKFRVTNLDAPTLIRDSIGAEVDYDFQAETFASVTLIRALA